MLVAAAVGVTPKAMEQIASVWIRIIEVALLKGLVTAVEVPPIAAVCSAMGSTLAIVTPWTKLPSGNSATYRVAIFIYLLSFSYSF
jgi:hypothetical protein